MSKELLALGFLLTGLALAFGLFATTPGLAQDAITPTPPAPTWTPGPAPVKTPVPTATAPSPAFTPQPEPSVPSPVEGAQITLHLKFAADWPWDQIGWPDLQTVVQWQDEQGKWRVVAGWRGALDRIESVDGQWTGQKSWWVAAAGLGTGPFRWLVYRADTGALLTISEPFRLPTMALQTAVVEVNLE